MPTKNQTWKPLGMAGVRSSGVYSSVFGVPRYRPSETKLSSLPLKINAAEALSSTANPLLFENPTYCRVVCLARKAEAVVVAVIVKIKPVPLVLAEVVKLVVTLVDIGVLVLEEICPGVLEVEDLEDEELEDEDLEDEDLEDEDLEDEDLEDNALVPVLLVEVEALMGPTEIVVDDGVPLLILLVEVVALMGPTESDLEDDVLVLVLLDVDAPIGPTELEAIEDEVLALIGPALLLKEVVEVDVVLAPMGPPLGEGVEVVLALI